MADYHNVENNSSSFSHKSALNRSTDQPTFLTEVEFVGSGDRDYRRERSLSRDHRRSRSKSKNRLSVNNLSLSTGNFYEDLEDYVREMASTRGSEATSRGNEVDVWTQLQQKESDLLLAAELGKALLEKNEELKKEQDKLSEECAKKIENLEQEKHLLRRKLDTSSSEYETRILELQNDIKNLTSRLDDRDSNVKQEQRNSSNLINQLTTQNSRLTQQLKDASSIEVQLKTELQELKDQCSMRKTTLQEHAHSMESLKDELNLVNTLKGDLEKRLQMTLGDKENLMHQLEDARDRIMALKRQVKEYENLYQNTLKELERLQRSHDTLAERLGGTDQSSADSGPRSLHTEMDDGCEESAQDWLQDEAMAVYRQLRTLVLQLHTGHDDDSGLHSDLSLTSIEVSSCDNGRVARLRRGALLAACEDACAAAGALEGARVRDSIAAHARRALETERHIDEKNEIIADLQAKLSVAEVELRAAHDRQERALADASCSSMQSDEAVTRARHERDEAIERKKQAEISLAKTRVELMQASSQLLEAVRQKADLGQQLEQWQSDMQELIDDHMKRKLNSHEKRRKIPSAATPIPQPSPVVSRVLGFFQR